MPLFDYGLCIYYTINSGLVISTCDLQLLKLRCDNFSSYIHFDVIAELEGRDSVIPTFHVP